MTCQTCGNPHQQNFCPNCGEKRYNPHSLSFTHVAEETLESFTHADHTLIRTIRSVLLKPGELPADYVAGKRVRYMKPLGFFLVINLLFFLLSARNVFNQPLTSFLDYTPYINFGTKEAIAHLLAHQHQSLADYMPEFNASMTSSSKSYLVLLIPLYALVFGLLFISSGRTFIEHLIFSTYFIAFLLLFLLLETFIIILPIQWFFSQGTWVNSLDALVSVLSLVVVAVYLFLAFRRFYRTSVLWSVLAALASSGTFFIVVVTYRLLLFYKIVRFGH